MRDRRAQFEFQLGFVKFTYAQITLGDYESKTDMIATTHNVSEQHDNGLFISMKLGKTYVQQRREEKMRDNLM